MQWSPQQENALRAVAEWLNDPSRQVFRLFGYAGTGKTTLARHLAEGVNGLVLFGAFTGKASFILRTKGCDNAQTIHSMIYKSREKGKSYLIELESQLEELTATLQTEGCSQASIRENKKIIELQKLIKSEVDGLNKPNFVLNLDSIVKQADLVIIDECSMVDEPMGRDLLSFKKKVLVLGDPAQLPPVGGAGFFTNAEPDILLTDIHRQAAESPIIRLATLARKQKEIEDGFYEGGSGDDYSSVLVTSRSKIMPNQVLAADQLLVGRNATRTASNMKIRKLLGRTSPLPEKDDRIVCLRNNKSEQVSVLNGEIFIINEILDTMDNKILATIRSDFDGAVQEVLMHEHHFLGTIDQLKWYEKKDAEEFDFGNALTVHKFQGSQCNNCMLFDESSAFRKDWWRWLYTGITRAAQHLTIARD